MASEEAIVKVSILDRVVDCGGFVYLGLIGLELRLGLALSKLCILTESHQVLIVIVFPLKGLFDGPELIIVADPFLLQPLHYQLISLFDAHGLIILDHGFVQAILHDTDHAHLWVVITVHIDLLSCHLGQLVLQTFQMFFLGLALIPHLIVLPLPHKEILVQLLC